MLFVIGTKQVRPFCLVRSIMRGSIERFGSILGVFGVFGVLGVLVGVAGVGSVLGTGCQGAGPPQGAISLLPQAAQKSVQGDRNDIETSVGYGLGQLGIASLRVDRPSPDVLIYFLKTSRDEPGVLRIEIIETKQGRSLEGRAATDQPSVRGPVRIRMFCTIGRFGDALRERKLMAAIGRRLGELAGVDVAPVQ